MVAGMIARLMYDELAWPVPSFYWLGFLIALKVAFPTFWWKNKFQKCDYWGGKYGSTFRVCTLFHIYIANFQIKCIMFYKDFMLLYIVYIIWEEDTQELTIICDLYIEHYFESVTQYV